MKFTLIFEGAAVDILGAGLGKLPLEVSGPVFNDLVAQVEQQKAAPPKLQEVPKAESA